MTTEVHIDLHLDVDWRMLFPCPPCSFKTTEGEQCVYWRLAWVMAKVKELRWVVSSDQFPQHTHTHTQTHTHTHTHTHKLKIVQHFCGHESGSLVNYLVFKRYYDSVSTGQQTKTPQMLRQPLCDLTSYHDRQATDFTVTYLKLKCIY